MSVNWVDYWFICGSKITWNWTTKARAFKVSDWVNKQKNTMALRGHTFTTGQQSPSPTILHTLIHISPINIPDFWEEIGKKQPHLTMKNFLDPPYCPVSWHNLMFFFLANFPSLHQGLWKSVLYLLHNPFDKQPNIQLQKFHMKTNPIQV